MAGAVPVQRVGRGVADGGPAQVGALVAGTDRDRQRWTGCGDMRRGGDFRRGDFAERWRGGGNGVVILLAVDQAGVHGRVGDVFYLGVIESDIAAGIPVDAVGGGVGYGRPGQGDAAIAGKGGDFGRGAIARQFGSDFYGIAGCAFADSGDGSEQVMVGGAVVQAGVGVGSADAGNFAGAGQADVGAWDQHSKLPCYGN